jgi:hypothetical protein
MDFSEDWTRIGTLNPPRSSRGNPPGPTGAAPDPLLRRQAIRDSPVHGEYGRGNDDLSNTPDQLSRRARVTSAGTALKTSTKPAPGGASLAK